VLIGRPIFWGLAVNGAEGVKTILELLRSELEQAMIAMGCSTVAEITQKLVKFPTEV